MTSYAQNFKTFHPWFALHLFVSFMEEKTPIQVYGVFLHFLRAYELAKFSMIKL